VNLEQERAGRIGSLARLSAPHRRAACAIDVRSM